MTKTKTADALLSEAETLYAEGEYDAGLMAAAAALGEIEANDDGSLRSARALYLVGQGHHHLDRLDVAAGFTDRAIAALERLGGGDAGVLGDALHARAVIHLQAEQLAEAMPLLSRAAALLDGAGDQPMALCGVLMTMAEVAHATEELDAAVDLVSRALDVLDGIDAESEQHAAMLNALWAKGFFSLGSVAARRGDVERAKDMLSRAIEFYDAAFGHGHPAMIAGLAEIAAIYRAIGQQDSALAIEEELAVAERMLREAEEAAFDLN